MKLRDVVDDVKYWVEKNPGRALILLAIVGAFFLGWMLG